VLPKRFHSHPAAVPEGGRQNRKAPPERGLFFKRLKGLEPSTFCMASRRSSQLSYSRETSEYNPGSHREISTFAGKHAGFGGNSEVPESDCGTFVRALGEP
jgi:hypothetical protein